MFAVRHDTPAFAPASALSRRGWLSVVVIAYAVFVVCVMTAVVALVVAGSAMLWFHLVAGVMGVVTAGLLRCCVGTLWVLREPVKVRPSAWVVRVVGPGAGRCQE
jgi:hypothetical protein